MNAEVRGRMKKNLSASHSEKSPEGFFPKEGRLAVDLLLRNPKKLDWTRMDASKALLYPISGLRLIPMEAEEAVVIAKDFEEFIRAIDREL
jgi:hypothetical protein